MPTGCRRRSPSRFTRVLGALGISDITNTEIATITLFQSVASLMLQTAIVDNSSHTESAVFANRKEGLLTATAAHPAINKPTIKLLLREASVCGKTNAEMNNQAPRAMFTNRGHGLTGRERATGAVGVTGVVGF
jgi:hypothetical protein